ncbi:MAG: ACP S-malonyltransferase [Planctomycetes bacterium]|nr:ACP S-malonyltransferase [Planctomycetota bacterium]
MKGILADVHMIGDVETMVAVMQRPPWTEFWDHLGLALYRFEDVGLTPTSTDLEIWQRCQAEHLVLITDNRNDDSEDSLESALRAHNTSESLPVFTIGTLTQFQNSKMYFNEVVDRLLIYLLDIDRVRGAGRLYLP